MKGYIYLIENKINGKKYIGKTYRTIDLRWKEHLKERFRFPDRPLYRAINKYGIDGFEIKELEYIENPEIREIYWITLYNSFNNGYNATQGGDGTLYFPYSDEEVLNKYSELKTIRQVAQFFNCDVSTISNRLHNNGIEPKPQVNIYAENRSWKAKKVNQYSLKEEYIQSFNSYSEAANWLIENNYTEAQPKHIISNISKVCRNSEGRKKSYNFIWKNAE